MSDGPRAAVVTVTHNSSRVIEAWLDALEGSGVREELEVCVVDSGSSPEQVAATRRLTEGRVEVFLAVPNLGFGRASNIGAGRTSAPVLMFLNPDAALMALPSELLDPEHVRGAIVGCTLLPGDQPVPSAGFVRAPTARWEASSLVLGRHAATYDRTFDAPAYVSGGTLLMTREDFARLGGFSPELFLYFEDADLCLRHRALGGALRIDRGWLVHHGGAASSGGLWRVDALDGLARLSARRLAARHEGRLQPVLLWALLALVYVPRRAIAEARRGDRARVLEVLLDLLLPGRIMRRLGAVPPDPVASPGTR